MIKVMIADDEPFIRQGLKILINWDQYGFEICGEAANGKEALELMGKGEYDLIITDIRMPNMDGLDLIEYTWEYVSEHTRFILLSGFYEFEYARKAIKYGVEDYVLKPVQKDELIHALENYKEQYFKKLAERKRLEYSDKLVFDRRLANIISDKYDEESLEYVRYTVVNNRNVRYISIEYDPSEPKFKALTKEGRIKVKNELYDALRAHLGDHWYHAYLEAHPHEEIYGVGFLFARGLAEEAGLCEKDYIQRLYLRLTNSVSYKLTLYIGQRVEDISRLSDSYKSVTIARTFQLFSKEKDIAYYDEIEGRQSTNRHPADKEMMDELIRSIEENDIEAIGQKIDTIYEHFKELVKEPDIIKINLDYLLFNLISLARDLDAEFDQEEVYRRISQGGYEQIAVRGSVKHLKDFALEFSGYLLEVRQHTFGGVLTEIEREITEHYMDNLSLKSLSEKYYINSAYLGQIFKKQFGSPFKDYLNNYRIDRAAELLLRSNEKIYLIAGEVGFNNTDYFISKFVQIKGKTPLQYRKQYITPKG